MHDLLLTVVLAGLLAAALMFVMGEHRAASVLRRLDAVLGRTPRKNPGAQGTGAVRFLPGKLARNLEQLGVEASPRGLILIAAAFLLAVFGIGVLLSPLAALMAGACIAGVAYAVLNMMAARRIAQTAALLPGFFERVRQLLTIGNSLPMAFARAVQSSQPILLQFFAPTMRRLGNGAPFSESMQQCADDADVYELRLFAAAVATNMRFGGSLTHSLTNLVAYLRKRASIERELRSSTAQIRGSAWVLGLLPLLVASLIVSENREYARWFVSHPTGKMMLVYCVVSQIVGALAMRKIVRTRF